ncbi:MAG: DUF1015 family protein [Eubacteriales bacterium]|nr:DUF1015 family protein [Eubacteriales bacterium]
MADIKAFRGVRPAEGLDKDIISLPYDVVSEEEALEEGARKPLSFLHVVRSEIDVPDRENDYTDEVYAKAKSNLDALMENGQLVRDEKPYIYIYRESIEELVQTGIICCVNTNDVAKGIVKRHELTRAAKERDRAVHIDRVSADTGLVFLTYRDDLRITALVEGYLTNEKPDNDLVADTGVRHQLWVVRNESVSKELIRLLSEKDSLYIADGHHRCEASCRVAEKRRREAGLPEHPEEGDDRSLESDYFMVGLFPESDLNCFAYNRYVKDLNGLTPAELIDKVREAGFGVDDWDDSLDPEHLPAGKHVFSMYVDGNWYNVKVPEELIPEDPVESLDVALIQKYIIGSILGIDDPRTSDRIDFVGGVAGDEVLEQMADKTGGVSFSVFPVSMGEVMDVADDGRQVPPKSTWFEPKLASGLVIHTI